MNTVWLVLQLFQKDNLIQKYQGFLVCAHMPPHCALQVDAAHRNFLLQKHQEGAQARQVSLIATNLWEEGAYLSAATGKKIMWLSDEKNWIIFVGTRK